MIKFQSFSCKAHAHTPFRIKYDVVVLSILVTFANKLCKPLWEEGTAYAILLIISRLILQPALQQLTL